jgi:hypothetical protein
MSAGICGISIQDFLASLSTFFMTSLLCGLFGSMIGRILGQRRSIRFLITRLFLTFLLFATGFFGPYVNPILLICEINKGEKMLVSHLISAYSLYMGIAVIASGLLMMGIHVIIRRDKK